MKRATLTSGTSAANTAETKVFRNHCCIGFLTCFSSTLVRNPVLPLFAAAPGAGLQGIGFAVGISTVTCHGSGRSGKGKS